MNSTSAAHWFERIVSKVGGTRRRRQPRSVWAPAIEHLEDRKLLTLTALNVNNWQVVAQPTIGSVGIGTMLLLTDGTIMAQAGDTTGNNVATANWMKLTPDQFGNYANGTWSQLTSSPNSQLFYASDVLKDGRVFVFGGEDTATEDSAEANTGQIYDPISNSWFAIPNFPQLQGGDAPSELLPSGSVLTGFIGGPQTYTYNPGPNNWTPTGNKQRDDSSSEENWVKLPNGDILSYDISASIANGLPTAQVFNPTTNSWTKAGFPPVQLSNDNQNVNFELGTGVLLQNGKVLYIGGNGATAFYNYKTNAWTRGPNLPDGLGGDDQPAAVLPDGNVIFTADPNIATNTLFASGAQMLEYHPGSNTFTQVVLPQQLQEDMSVNPAFIDRMLVLPTGQVAFSDGISDQLFLYSENLASTGAKPVVTGITGGSGNFTLYGTKLNGPNEGAYYGDDAQMSSNYPIIYLQNASGQVFYARTSNWSLPGAVATGNTPESVNFTIPTGMPTGNYTLFVSGAGINSVGTTVFVSGSSLVKGSSSAAKALAANSSKNSGSTTPTNTSSVGGLHTTGAVTQAAVTTATTSSTTGSTSSSTKTTTTKTTTTAGGLTTNLGQLDSVFSEASVVHALY